MEPEMIGLCSINPAENGMAKMKLEWYCDQLRLFGYQAGAVPANHNY